MRSPETIQEIQLVYQNNTRNTISIQLKKTIQEIQLINSSKIFNSQ